MFELTFIHSLKRHLFAVLGNGRVNFDGFCRIAGRFMEEEDEQVMQHELKEAFRMYDKEGERK